MTNATLEQVGVSAPPPALVWAARLFVLGVNVIPNRLRQEAPRRMEALAGRAAGGSSPSHRRRVSPCAVRTRREPRSRHRRGVRDRGARRRLPAGMGRARRRLRRQGPDDRDREYREGPARLVPSPRRRDQEHGAAGEGAARRPRRWRLRRLPAERPSVREAVHVGPLAARVLAAGTDAGAAARAPAAARIGSGPCNGALHDVAREQLPVRGGRAQETRPTRCDPPS